NAARARQVDEAIELLRSWDHRADTSSVEATLFVLWQERLRSGTYVGEYARFRALEDATAWLEQEQGSSMVAWGAVNRLRRPGGMGDVERGDVPVGGAPAWAGGMLVIEAAAGPGGERVATGGTRLVTVVEMGTPVRMSSVIPFGQVADPGSSHWMDQASSYA